MNSYSEIFNEIVDIVHSDYAGYEEKQDWDEPEYYREEIKKLEGQQELTPQKFTEIVDDYLISFQDRHMYFNFEGSDNVKTSTRGFRTRRYKDVLYVIETFEENRFPKGSKIVAIDDRTINQVIASNPSSLRGTSAEREDWSHIINKSSFVTIENENGEHIKFGLKDYEPVSKKKEHTLEVINEGTLVITLPSFADVDSTLDFVKNQDAKIKKCTNLIIDVRNNNGGNGQAISTLVPYIFPSDEHPSTEGELREFNYTNRNSDLFIQLCQNFRKDIKDQETLDVLDFAEEQCKKYRGQGFVALDFSDSLKDKASKFEGTDFPKKVVVMTDVYCASAAEYFVEMSMSSSKVTVIGRSTMGVNDYSDLVIKKWADMFSLYYPISRRVQKTLNHPLHGKGIQPDRYIPWTPEHIYKDIDLLYALEILKEEVNI